MESAEQSARRVAVIAVHGVGDQAPGATARAVARALQRSGGAAYSPFLEEAVSVEVGTPPLPRAEPVTGKAAAPGSVRSEFARRNWAQPEAGDWDANLEFTRQTLEAVRLEGGGRHYDTVCLGGLRQTPAGPVEVDIYELHWSDLSRLAGGPLRVLSEFYQVLFHLVSVGQKTLETATLGLHPAPSGLAGLLWLQRVAEWLLCVAVPVLNLFIAGVFLPVALEVLAPGWLRPAAALLGAAMAGWLCWRHVSRRVLGDGTANPRRPWEGLLALLGASLGCGGVAYAGLGAVPDGTWWAYVLLTVAGAVLALDLCRRLQRARGLGGGAPPRTPLAYLGWPAGAGAVVATLVVATLTWLWARPPGEAPLTAACRFQTTLHAEEPLLALLNGLWLVFMAVGAVHALLGLWLRWRCRAVPVLPGAVRTALISLAVPGSLFIVLTMVLWYAVFELLKSARAIADCGVLQIWFFDRLPVVGAPGLRAEGGLPPDLFFQGFENLLAGPGADLLVLMLAAALALCVAAILPSVLAEVRRPRHGPPMRSEGLGGWLDQGFGFMSVAGALVTAGLFFVFPGVAAAELLGWSPAGVGNTLLPSLGSAAVGTAGVLVALRKQLMAGSGAVLDILLDVDNWLREKPLDRAPRGHMLARAWSLLRHVLRQGRYQRVVFAAHSQGTVIVADLLRALAHYQVWPVRRPPPLALLSFGSPLRQLYQRRITPFYRWVAASRGMPKALGLTLWVNAYCSGDYVGRQLWDGPEPYAVLDDGAAVPQAGTQDRCLGPGAHTHYLEPGEDGVARILDRMICAR